MTERGPLRVVFLLQDLLFGGTQRQALDLARRLDPERFKVEIWTLMAGEDFDPQSSAPGLAVVRLGRSARVGLAALARLFARLRREPVDILVLLTVVPNIHGRVFGLMARVPVILGTCRGRGSPTRQHERLLWPLADHVLCNAASLGRVLVRDFGLPEGRVSVIENGLDLKAFTPAGPDAKKNSGEGPVVLCVARLARDKDHETLLRAFALVARKHPQARLRLVGDGPLEAEVKALARGLLPEGRAVFTPGNADLLGLYQEASVFALSSRQEGFPNAVAEAMACGLPVAATGVDGVAELVEHGVSGLLSPARDHEALARNLTRLLDDPALAREMGALGRARVLAKCSMERMVERHQDLFDALWAARKRGK
ncbi:MAG: glycosyltransferase family 4 protein [Desulfovibrionaceae bacterium]|nr:glycosyltransferase family 4 protein [Desulfovibrionaceae bacterium]